MSQQVDAVRRTTELNDDTGGEKFVGALQRWDLATPELLEREKEAFHVCRGPLVEKVDVAGEPRIPVKDHGLTADDQVAHPMTLEQLEQLLNVGGEVFARHGSPRVRRDPANTLRTSGASLP